MRESRKSNALISGLRRHGPRLVLAGALAAAYFALGGCEPIQFGPENPEPGDSASGTASLLLMNQRDKHPGKLVFQLYPPGVQDIDNANPTREYDPVDFGGSLSVKVPEGRWKVAYRMETGDLYSMPPNDTESTSAGWPVSVFAKGKSHQILIETEAGGNIVWRHNVPVEPSGD